MNPGKWNWKVIVGVAAMVTAVFCLVSSNWWLKRPILTGEKDVGVILTGIERELLANDPDWGHLSVVTEELNQAWVRVRTRIQYNGEKDNILRFDRAIDLLAGSLKIGDTVGAMEQLSLLRSLWKDI